MHHFRTAPIALLIVAVAASTACNLQISTDVEAKDTWTRSYPMTETGSFSINNTNGRITIDAADITTVEVTAERIVKARTEETANEQLKLWEFQEQVSPDSVSIDSSARGLSIGVSRNAHYIVRVPRGIAVTLKSTNGEVTATGIRGTFSASATNGRIIGHDLHGSVQASTTNGVINLTMAAIGANGVSAETTNGQVIINLPRSANADVSARVTNGAISHENLDLQITESSRRRLDGRLGTGGPAIRVETTNGAVRLIGQ